MTGRLTVLILGGYGTFGGRLARLLADEARLSLIIAGRSRARADAFCRLLAGTAQAIPVAIDRDSDLGPRLDMLRPDVVVDASGPFQSYGPEPYRVVQACLERGITYLDLADGSDFVAGIGRFDAPAQAACVTILSGLSSFPVLTVAAVTALGHDLVSIETVTGGIAPSPYAGVGANVVRAIAGYAGQPIGLTREGRKGFAHALTESISFTISPPGRVPLRRTRFSLVDVPDLRVLPERWPALSSAWIGAGPVPEMLHRALNLLAWLVRLKLLPSLAPLAPLFTRVINVVRWGEDRGGMFVSITGRTAGGASVQRSWHLLAEGDDGPLIPSMAAEAIVRNMLAGAPPRPGARSGAGELSLADYGHVFRRRTIFTGCRDLDPGQAGKPLYRRLLGEAWDRLPPAVQALHSGTGHRSAAGVAQVERGAGGLARLAAWFFGFPPAGQEVPAVVSFIPKDDGELWRRDFGGRVFESLQSQGHGRSEWLLSERFGPVTVDLALVVHADRLLLVPRRARVFGLPLPRALLPGGESSESVQDGRFRFDVEIGHPWTGLIVRYRGWLEPCPKPRSGALPNRAIVEDAVSPDRPPAVEVSP